MTQKELAEPGYTAAYVSTIEAGRRTPSAEALAHFASKLRVTVDYLATGRSPDLVPRIEDTHCEGRRALARGNVAEARGLFTKAARLAKRNELPALAAKAKTGLGLCAEADGDLDEAVRLYLEVEAELADDPLGSIDALVNRARCLHTRGEIRLGLYLLEQRLHELRAAGLDDPSALMRLNSSLVAGYFDLHLRDLAYAAAEEALALSTRVEDPERLANMHINVARVLLEQGRGTDAQHHFTKAQELFSMLDYRVDVGRTHLARGFFFRERGELEAARRELIEARSVFRSANSTLNEARVLNELARVERAEGKVEAAEALLNTALDLDPELDPAIAGIAHRELGLLHRAKDPARALEELRRSVELFERAGDVRELVASYREIGDLMRHLDQLPDACDAYRAAARAYETAA
jgi:tetratricopeptide (TPR) repeat protein